MAILLELEWLRELGLAEQKQKLILTLIFQPQPPVRMLTAVAKPGLAWDIAPNIMQKHTAKRPVDCAQVGQM